MILLDSRIKMRDFLHLKVGDVIPSEKKINLPATVTVNKRCKFVAKPGLAGKKRAFQVVGLWHEPTEESKDD